jgi:DNA-binding transcriptional LysR family regulator
MDRFDDLVTFTVVAELRSVRNAAEVLGRAPSAVSRRIKDLEERLQVQLLTRTTRNIALTGAGERFYNDALRILDDLKESETRVSAEAQTVNGELRMTMPLSFGVAHLAPAVSDFMLQHPKVKFDTDYTDNAINLIENRIDLAIRIGTLKDSSLKSRRLAPIHQVVAASPSFWEEHGLPRNPQKLEGLPGLCYSNLSSPNVWSWSNARGKSGKVTLETRYRASNGDALVEAATRGLGVVRLPTFLVNQAIENGALQPVLLNNNWGRSELFALYPNTTHLPHRCRIFIDFLIDRFSGYPAWDECLRKHLSTLAKTPSLD